MATVERGGKRGKGHQQTERAMQGRIRSESSNARRSDTYSRGMVVYTVMIPATAPMPNVKAGGRVSPCSITWSSGARESHDQFRLVADTTVHEGAV